MDLLVRNYNINTIPELMCRNLLSVSWNGRLYDCDFNQQMEINMMDKDDKEGTVYGTAFENCQISQIFSSNSPFSNYIWCKGT